MRRFTKPGSNRRLPRGLLSLSTRGDVAGGNAPLICGFVIAGTAPRRILIRGAGPGLAAFGVARASADPRLTVFSGASVIAQNNDWSAPQPGLPGQPVATAVEIAAAARSVGAFPFAADSKDTALILRLPPSAYTAQVAGADATAGTALVEIYELPE